MLDESLIAELFDLANVQHDRRDVLLKEITQWARMLQPDNYKSVEIVLHNRGRGVWLFSKNRLMSICEMEPSKKRCAHFIPLCSFRRCSIRTQGFSMDSAGNLESYGPIEIELEFQDFSVSISADQSYAGTAMSVIARNIIPFINSSRD